jgi:secreted trypsin-like serine protease
MGSVRKSVRIAVAVAFAAFVRIQRVRIAGRGSRYSMLLTKRLESGDASRIVMVVTVLGLGATFGVTPGAATSAAAPREAKVPSDRIRAHGAIVGGEVAEGSLFESLALIRDVRADVTGVCSGTVVAPTVVLTAAHCAENEYGAVNTPAGYSVTITRGGNRLATGPTGGTEVAQVSKVMVDPVFKRALGVGDAAVLILARPVSIPAVRLDTGDGGRVRAGTPGLIAGWGLVAYSESTLPSRPEAASTFLQRTKWCTRHARAFHRGTELCSIDPPLDTTGTCDGDSGGPLLIVGRGKMPVEIGIVSRGSPTCSPKQPTVFTSVQSLSGWLRGVLPH